MFDKGSRIVVQAVHVAGTPSQKPNWIGTFLLPSAALIISLSSLGVAWMAYSANQEGLNVAVKRDISAALEADEPQDAVYPGYERADAVYLAKWNVSIVNTSVTATTPITGFNIVVQRFNGATSTFTPGGIALPSKLTRLLTLEGSDIELPLALKAGEVRKFILTTAISLSKKAFTKPPTLVRAAPLGSIIGALGDGMMDIFGNEGKFVPGSYTTANGAVAQPCIRLSFETGSGNHFFGVGYWYSHVYADTGGGIIREVRPQACQH